MQHLKTENALCSMATKMKITRTTKICYLLGIISLIFIVTFFTFYSVNPPEWQNVWNYETSSYNPPWTIKDLEQIIHAYQQNQTIHPVSIEVYDHMVATYETLKNLPPVYPLREVLPYYVLGSVGIFFLLPTVVEFVTRGVLRERTV